MVREISVDDVLAAIKVEIADSSLRKVAKRIGITPAYLSDIMHRRRAVSSTIAEAFGFERKECMTITFRKKKVGE